MPLTKKSQAFVLLLFWGTSQAVAYPLDSLTAAEIRVAVGVLRTESLADNQTRFPQIRLLPPDKASVWGWSKGRRLPRRALLVVRRGVHVREVIVDLGDKRLVSVKPRPDVQSNITGEEWDWATQLVKSDVRWQTAMRARGLADFQHIFCDALSIGNFGIVEPRRLLKVPCYDARGTTNVYGRPIEGVMSTVDLNSRQVVSVSDSGSVPISTADPSLEQKRQTSVRRRLKPIVSSSPAGFNFAIDGNLVRWAAWSFHLSFDQRVGPVVSTVRYRDQKRDRPILFSGHLAEMFVPYMDPDPNWAFRSYMDVGEYGFGMLASQLVAGSDCPPGAIMLPVVLPSYAGEPLEPQNLMCAFERNSTLPLWRRLEIVTGSYEARQDVEFVLRTISTVGNYDYILDWVFNLKGEIRIDVGATGIAAAKGVTTDRANEGTNPFGTQVERNLVAPYHDHHLAFRLDLDVDGPENSFVQERLVRKILPRQSARRSVWTREPTITQTESAIDADHEPHLWRVENPSVVTPLGYHPSFELAADHSAVSLLDPNDPPQQRAAFSSNPLWVTAYKADELYAAGDYPNQSTGDEGLPRYVNGERVNGRDLVVWYNLGFHHVTRPEDWPVLPTVRHSLTLRPHRFFVRNPGMEVARDFEPPRDRAKR